MGGNKPLRLLRGRPLYQYPLDVLRTFCDPILSVGLELPECRHVPDESPGQGPLGGILSGLRMSPHRWCLCLAADMPSVSPTLVRELCARRSDEVVAVVPEGPQPLVALYSRDLIAGLEARLRQGQRRVVEWVRGLDAVAWVEGHDPASFRNLNTPEELEE